MRNRRAVNALQNAALLLLTVSALFLLLHTPMVQGGWALASPAASLASPPAQEPAGELSGMLGSVHVMVTADSEYGRFGQLCAGGEDALVQQVIPLFREALGSAAELEAATQQEFRDALAGMAIYLDFTVQLPLTAVAACLGETADSDRPVRAAALAAGAEEAVSLYLRSEDGALFRCATALPMSAVEAICAGVQPNGSSFAYETGYTALEPYTLLVAQVAQPPELQADLPALYTEYHLLTALDFNAHTNFWYTDRDGAVVVEESPRTLRIGPDGTVQYSSTGTELPPLYRVSGGQGRPALPETLRAAWNLATALTNGTGASALRLSGAEETEAGYVIRFRYQAEGVAVHFPDESDALAVTVGGAGITGFTYRCRAYTPVEEAGAPLLPPAMAAAIASLHPDSGLSVAYVDTGASRLSPCWLS